MVNASNFEEISNDDNANHRHIKFGWETTVFGFSNANEHEHEHEHIPIKDDVDDVVIVKPHHEANDQTASTQMMSESEYGFVEQNRDSHILTQNEKVQIDKGLFDFVYYKNS